jgi:glycerol-3-phosphate dehydrogenase (NAD(P)+)
VKVAVLGAGAWGTALAKLLIENAHQVSLWAHRPERLAELAASGRNDRYLPKIALPAAWRLEPEIAAAIDESDCVVVALPSRVFRGITSKLAAYRGLIVSVTKGIEYNSGLTMSGVLRQTTPQATVVAMSGPTFALEVARGIPTAIVAASESGAAAQTVQQVFHRPAFRVYTNPDLLGVELGGALKNVVAIAAGTCDGLGFGDNSKAALITRGIVEMRRLGVACGAQPETFSGLSGLGDLAATCYSRLSRNRAFGERLGRREPLAEVVRAGPQPEGYPTTQAAWQLARKLGVPTPIIDECYALLYEGKNAAQAVQDLTQRESKAENW